MRTLYFGNNNYTFPDSWAELTPDQYQSLVAVLLDFLEGTITAENAQALWFCTIAELDPGKVLHSTRSNIIAENIYRASREFNFYFKIEYEKSIAHLSKESRKLLHKRPPAELPKTPEIRWASKLKYKYIPDTVFAAQLIPVIKVKSKEYHGYSVKLSGGLLDVSINAQQYIDANTLLDEYYRSSDFTLLNTLLAILYFPKYYNSEKVHELAPEFDVVNPLVKHAVLLNFQAFTQFLALKTKYGIMWNRTQTKKTPEITVGFSDTLYSLAKLGYGTVDELSHINLMRFLDLSLKNIIDTVQYLHENEVPLTDIADKTNLSVANIQKLL